MANSTQWLVRLYPQAWRTRYEDEFLALLEQRPPTARDQLDLLRGALDAHLRAALVMGRGMPVDTRLRRSEIAIFWGFVLFGVGYLGLQRLPDPLATWQPATRGHPEIAVAFNTMVVAGVLAFLAFVAGGAPVVLSALKHAWIERRRESLALFGGATALGLLFVAYSGAALLVIGTRPGGTGIRPLRTLDIALTLGWLGFFLVCLVAIPLCASLAIARGPLSARVVRFALLPGAGVTLAMGIACVAALVLGALLLAEAPSLITGAITQDVGWRIMVISILLMVGGTALAARALVGGLRARVALA